jgi:hypothetical protein
MFYKTSCHVHSSSHPYFRRNKYISDVNFDQFVGFNLKSMDTILLMHINHTSLSVGINKKLKVGVHDSYQLQDIIYDKGVPYYNITNKTHNKFLSTKQKSLGT